MAGCQLSSQPLDSLLSEIQQTTDDSTKAVLLCKASMQLYYSYPDSANKFIMQAREIGERIKDNTILAKSFNIQGIIYDVTNRWDSALISYERALFLAGEAGDKTIEASALNNIGLIYWNKGEYDKAIDFYNSSLLLFEELDNQRGIANTLNNIGLILWEQDRLVEALDYHRRSLKKRLAMGDHYGIGASYSNISRLHDETGSKDSAYFYAYRAVVIQRSIHDNYGLAITFNNLASMYQADYRIDSAFKYYFASVERYKDLGNLGRCASSLYNLADLYKNSGDLASSEKYLLEALDYAKKADARNILYKIYGNLGRLYHETGRDRLAYSNLLRRIEIHDSIYDIERDEIIAEIQAKYETEKKDKEIALLGQKGAEAELKVAKRNRTITGLSLGSLALVFLGLFVIQRNRRRSQAAIDRALILEKEKGLEAVFAAQEEERKRIAKELHDGIVQELAGVILGWRRLAGEKRESDTEESFLLHSLEEASGELREVSHQMMPKAISELGIVAALEDMFPKTFRHVEIKYVFEHFGIVGRLPEKIELALFRISQELVNNVIKHSGAGNVSIQLLQTSGSIVLIMDDDGKGFSGDFRNKGIGLMNIKSRAETLKGSVLFENNTSGGATVTVKIPIRQDD